MEFKEKLKSNEIHEYKDDTIIVFDVGAKTIPSEVNAGTIDEGLFRLGLPICEIASSPDKPSGVTVSDNEIMICLERPATVPEIVKIKAEINRQIVAARALPEEARNEPGNFKELHPLRQLNLPSKVGELRTPKDKMPQWYLDEKEKLKSNLPR